MKCCRFLTVVFFLVLPVFASADSPENQPAGPTGNVANTKPEPAPDTPEEKAYKAKMIMMSDAITKKIAEIQAKQRAIETEVYPAYKPPLIAEKAILEEELHKLEMERDKMQTQKIAQDMQKQLKNEK